jgi:hypothetical protein
MADVTQQQDTQHQGKSFDDTQSQGQYDSAFTQQISAQTGPLATSEAWGAYFDLAEQTLRTARRVSELQVMSLMRQQIVNEVKQQVIAEITSNPALAGSRR